MVGHRHLLVQRRPGHLHSLLFLHRLRRLPFVLRHGGRRGDALVRVAQEAAPETAALLLVPLLVPLLGRPPARGVGFVTRAGLRRDHPPLALGTAQLPRPCSGGAQAGQGVHRPAVGAAQLEVEVGGGGLGVAGVAHPADDLAGGDPGAFDHPRCDAHGAAVVGARGVVVQVDVARAPAVVVEQGDVAAVLAPLVVDPAHRAVGHRHHGHHALGHDVDTGVAAAAAPGVAEGVGQGVVAQEGEDHGVDQRLAGARRALGGGRQRHHRQPGQAQADGDQAPVGDAGRPGRAGPGSGGPLPIRR